MTQFSNICGTSPINNQILFFDGYDSNFDNGALRLIMFKNNQPFVLKSGDSTNNQTNDNVPNAKLKFLYNMANSAWLLKYGTTKFPTHHMNYVLVEAWDYFKM